MKILLCTLEYFPQIGGVANYYKNLIGAWSASDSWVILDNHESTLMSQRGPLRWWRAIVSLLKHVRLERPDFVFIGQILPLGTAAVIAHIFTPFDYGVFLHGMDLSFALKTKRKRWLSKVILKRSKLIVCANSYVQKMLIEAWPELTPKTLLLNPGAIAGKPDPVLVANYRQRFNLDGKKVLFSIGRLVKRKGFDQVIKALSNLTEDNWVYLLAGDGPERASLEAEAIKSTVANKIFFPGSIDDSEKWSCLDLCDIFITTSRDLDGDFEGFGIVYLEANLLSKPVIAGRAGGVSDAVVDNFNGLLVDPENTAEITAAISKLFTQNDLAENLGRRGRERAMKDFSWSTQAEKLYLKLNSFLS